MTLSAAILGASVWGPGLPGWASAHPVLAGDAPYVSADAPPPAPLLLPSAERRRCGPVVRLALAVAHDAATRAGIPPAELRAVFASSNGDGPVVGAILEALSTAETDRVVSPTQFHNSVHNAAAGYWSIATASRQPATCLGCHDESFVAGLLTALAEMRAAGAPVLLCCYDHKLPPPLDAVRPTGPAFATALVLAPQGRSMLHARYEPEAVATPSLPTDPALRALARSNPAARALPLLQALAAGRDATMALSYLDGRVMLDLAS